VGTPGIGNGDLFSFHIITDQAQIVVSPAEDAFNGTQSALLGDGTAGDIQACYQHAFFTGKTYR
jgi:hypothetical protein